MKRVFRRIIDWISFRRFLHLEEARVANMAHSTNVLCSIVLLGLAGWSPLLAQRPINGTPIKKEPASQFIRIQRDAKNEPVALETSIVRYKPASGEGDLIVDLIGVVHVGDQI